MEVRIADGPAFYEEVRAAVEAALREREMIPQVSLSSDKELRAEEKRNRECEARSRAAAPEPFETRQINYVNQLAAVMKEEQAGVLRQTTAYQTTDTAHIDSGWSESAAADTTTEKTAVGAGNVGETGSEIPAGRPEQMALFEDRVLSAGARQQYEIIGQLFETYWLISYQEKLLIVDQHAAHEKVRYERLMRHFNEKDIVSQSISPPVILTLNNREKECYLLHEEIFASLGFEIEAFGGNEYTIRGVPMDLYGYTEETFFYEILDELAAEPVTGAPESVRSRIATMACKAAVKGSTRLDRQEMEALLDELLTLDNPYNCPHGRPTIVSMSKYEIEKKFKRIV